MRCIEYEPAGAMSRTQLVERVRQLEARMPQAAALEQHQGEAAEDLATAQAEAVADALAELKGCQAELEGYQTHNEVLCSNASFSL